MPRIALISDTTTFCPEALAFLAGSDYIVHGGDIGILARLAAIAPVSVVRGNDDMAPWVAVHQPTQRGSAPVHPPDLGGGVADRRWAGDALAGHAGVVVAISSLWVARVAAT